METLLIIGWLSLITALLIILEGVFGSTDTIEDIGFELVKPFTVFLQNDLVTASILAAGNTILVMCSYYYLLMLVVLDDELYIAKNAILMFVARLILGSLTRLPRPETYIDDPLDFPNIINHGKFIYFFSGHTAIVAMTAQIINGDRGNIIHVINILQGIRLIAIHGHYTIDVIVGIAVGLYAGNNVNKERRCFNR